MPYAAVPDIQSEFKNLEFAAGNPVTDTEVTEWISQEEAGINAVLANKYVVPVTSGDGVLILKSISIAFTAYRAAKVVDLKNALPIPEKYVPAESSYGDAYTEAKKKLNAIVSGDIVLPGATPVAESTGISSYNSKNSVEPLWIRDKAQW